ncbi:MAG: peptidylprolyl isomerase, partial [Acidobacteria bacterium]|nr:peptidylprolyl isomerase [Acidobacteriota bacterium]
MRAAALLVMVGLLMPGAATARAQGVKPRPATAKPAPAKPATPTAPALFTTPLSFDEMRGKQAVLTTAAGDIVIDLLPEYAPNHVGLFIKTAREGGLTGTTFHRVVRQGIVQGGDPLTKDPATRGKAGTGGLNLVAREGLS